MEKCNTCEKEIQFTWGSGDCFDCSMVKRSRQGLSID